MLSKIVIGQTEKISFPELDLLEVYARIDTGARTSAIWASSVIEQNGRLKVKFFGKDTTLYTGDEVTFNTYDMTVVASSNGQKEKRYKIQLLVTMGGRRIRAWFTLADRSQQVYPVLIGRNVLRGKFIVDISHSNGRLSNQEKVRSKVLRDSLNEAKS